MSYITAKSNTPKRTPYHSTDNFPLLMEYISTGELYLFFEPDRALVITHEDADAVGTMTEPDITDASWVKALEGTQFTYTV